MINYEFYKAMWLCDQKKYKHQGQSQLCYAADNNNCLSGMSSKLECLSVEKIELGCQRELSWHWYFYAGMVVCQKLALFFYEAVV